MLVHIVGATAAVFALTAIFVAVTTTPMRFQKIVSPPKISAKIVDFPTKGPFFDKELTDQEAQELVRRYNEERQR